METTFFEPLSWASHTNIYEVNLRQYTAEGSFAAFEKHLPRLQDMGVEVLWFMPITPIATEKRLGTLGSYYACADYTATNPEFGSVADFKHLVDAAHTMGFKVIIDWVANHTGCNHRWVTEHPEYYRRNLDGNFFDAHGWADVIDLNYDNKDLWRAMIDAMRFWMDEAGIDGFRCDMAMLVNLEFWRAARTELDAVRPLFWLAECEDIHYHEVFDATYTWKFLHKMEAYYQNKTGLQGLDEVLDFYTNMFPPTAHRAFFTSNHDENSHSGSEYERLGDAAKAFAVLACTYNGIPLIYSGQELPCLKRLKFFDKDEIEWTGHEELHGFYKTLLTLRKNNAALGAGANGGNTYRLNIESDKILAFARKKNNAAVVVLLNLSKEDLWLEMKDSMGQGKFTDVFTGMESKFIPGKWHKMKAWEYRVYVNERI